MNNLFKHFRTSALFFGVALSLAGSGCGETDEKQDQAVEAKMIEAVQGYVAVVEASYIDSLSSAQAMDAKIKAFVQAPTAAGLAEARAAWLASREPYLQTEVYRFYQGPIDNENGPEGLINAWPLDEAHIDYVEGNPTAGIVNNTAIVIDEQSLMALNEEGKEENVATGYHAVEYLLWGQDNNPAGPGDRQHTDYLPVAQGGMANSDRRGLYLTTVSTLLTKHLQQMVQAWAPGVPTNYRSQFVTMPTRDAFAKALTGMIILSGFETGGERIRTALDSSDQEDEHSCFSDNTHRDMVQDVQGIVNVWNGDYKKLDGTMVRGVGLDEVVRLKDPALAEEVNRAMVESYAAAIALQAPFDQEILLTNPAGRARVTRLETALRAQEQLLRRVFETFGLQVPADPV